MRRSSVIVIRGFLTLMLAIVGTGWLGTLNGQVFDNSLVFLGCMVAGAAISLWGAADLKLSPLSRGLWGTIAFVLLAMAGLVAMKLPASYRFQESFNTNVKEKFRKVSETIGSGKAPE